MNFFTRNAKQTLEEWGTKSVRFYRTLGFFNQYNALSDEDLSDQLLSLHGLEWGENIDPKDELADLQFLKWDEERVWWQDTEADVCGENKVYVQTLLEWGHISRGAFKPTNIEETWQSEEGPIAVAFSLDNTQHSIRPSYQDDYIDLSVVPQINNLIADSNLRFEIHTIFDQTAFIVMLTPEEKRLIERERKLNFVQH